MLILTRRIGEKVVISNNIEVAILSVRGSQVRLGIIAPRNISVHRQEVFEKLDANELKASFDNA